MKTTLVLAAIVGLTFGAPTENISSEIKNAEVPRKERSFGLAPCPGAGYPGPGAYSGGGYSGGGGYSNGGSYSGGGGYAPAPHYLPPQAPVLSPLPQYREDDKHEESDHSARSYYEPSLPALPAASGGYGSGAAASAGASLTPAPGPVLAPAPSAGSSAVGLFPHAKVGGCNVPLLLSCSPQVVAGHLAESHYSAPAYRNEEEAKREKRNTESKARVTSHHKISEDFPELQEPNPSSHHVVSQDYPEPEKLQSSSHVVSQDIPKPQQSYSSSHHVVSEDYPEPNLVVYTVKLPKHEDLKEKLD